MHCINPLNSARVGAPWIWLHRKQMMSMLLISKLPPRLVGSRELNRKVSGTVFLGNALLVGRDRATATILSHPRSCFSRRSLEPRCNGWAQGGPIGVLAPPPACHTFFAKVPPFCRYGNSHRYLRRRASLQTTPFFLQTRQSCKVDSERGVVHVDNRSMWIIDGKVAAPLALRVSVHDQQTSTRARRRGLGWPDRTWYRRAASEKDVAILADGFFG